LFALGTRGERGKRGGKKCVLASACLNAWKRRRPGSGQVGREKKKKGVLLRRISCLFLLRGVGGTREKKRGENKKEGAAVPEWHLWPRPEGEGENGGKSVTRGKEKKKKKKKETGCGRYKKGKGVKSQSLF